MLSQINLISDCQTLLNFTLFILPFFPVFLQLYKTKYFESFIGLFDSNRGMIKGDLKLLSFNLLILNPI